MQLIVITEFGAVLEYVHLFIIVKVEIKFLFITVFQTLKLCNYKKSIPVFTVVGRLLQAIPPLAPQLIQRYGKC